MTIFHLLLLIFIKQNILFAWKHYWFVRVFSNALRHIFYIAFSETTYGASISIRLFVSLKIASYTIGEEKVFISSNTLCKLNNIMITIDEANTFLTHQLKFANWKEVIERDKLEFLKLLVPYYAHNIYFQVQCFFF